MSAESTSATEGLPMSRASIRQSINASLAFRTYALNNITLTLIRSIASYHSHQEQMHTTHHNSLHASAARRLLLAARARLAALADASQVLNVAEPAHLPKHAAKALVEIVAVDRAPALGQTEGALAHLRARLAVEARGEADVPRE